ncbi:hypothetical protein [Runella sp.]|jgi:AraC-like DNA-binding protein|uniref:helix-turn-helix domain-containing protein n=1 Tax=Runella sp. TaxID=1960881 RepID=UPI0026122611|nr:hypothetical protein [Runella sp.]
MPIVKSEPSEPKNEKLTPIERIYQKYIRKMSESVPPNAATIAEEIGMSVSQFKSLFERRYGKTFSQCYIEEKMEYAATLLEKGFRASEVARE